MAAVSSMHYCTRRNEETVIQLSVRQRSAFKIALTALTLALLYFTLRGREDLSRPALIAAVRRFQPGNAFAVALLGIAQILFMILRMYVLCPTRPFASLRDVTFAVAVGHSVNMFFPARAGEALKVVWLGGAGGKNEGHIARGAGWVMADRIVDLLGFLVLLFTTGVLGLPAFQSFMPFSLWWFPVGIAAFLVLFGGISVISGGLHARLHFWVNRLREGLSGVFRPRAALLGVLAAIAAWTVEIVALGILATSQGHSLGIAQAFFVLVVLNLAIAVPISVANIGTFEASMAFALKFFGVPLATSVAIAGAHHLLQMFGVAGWALIALAWRRGNSAKSSSVASGPSA